MTGMKPPKWFWAVAVLALIWETIGVIAYLSQVSMSEADLAALLEGQRTLFTTMPIWVTSAYAIAVFGGVLAAVLLLVRRRLAWTLFVISLVAVLIQYGWAFGVAKAHEVIGPSAFGLPVTIVIVGALLVWFSGMSIKRDWLR